MAKGRSDGPLPPRRDPRTTRTPRQWDAKASDARFPWRSARLGRRRANNPCILRIGIQCNVFVTPGAASACCCSQWRAPQAVPSTTTRRSIAAEATMIASAGVPARPATAETGLRLSAAPPARTALGARDLLRQAGTAGAPRAVPAPVALAQREAPGPATLPAALETDRVVRGKAALARAVLDKVARERAARE
jgi:hypothetical protein